MNPISIELEAQLLRPGDRLRYGSLVLLCDRVAVSSDAVTIEGVRMLAEIAETAPGARETLALGPTERVRTVAEPASRPAQSNQGGLLP